MPKLLLFISILACALLFWFGGCAEFWHFVAVDTHAVGPRFSVGECFEYRYKQNEPWDDELRADFKVTRVGNEHYRVLKVWKKNGSYEGQVQQLEEGITWVDMKTEQIRCPYDLETSELK